jgi:hypothetical protein
MSQTHQVSLFLLFFLFHILSSSSLAPPPPLHERTYICLLSFFHFFLFEIIEFLNIFKSIDLESIEFASLSGGGGFGDLNFCFQQSGSCEVLNENVRWREISLKEADGLVANGGRGLAALVSPAFVTLFDMEDDDDEEEEEEEEDVVEEGDGDEGNDADSTDS